jgi:hypothetical protein
LLRGEKNVVNCRFIEINHHVLEWFKYLK